MTEWATDVIIVGGGVMGCAAAWRLARAGHRVRLLEQFAIGHTQGSSHGPSRMIRLAYDAPEYVQLGQAAFALWEELESESGESLLLRTGGINAGLPHANEMAGIARAYDRLAVPYERLDDAELRHRFPQLRFPEGTIGLYQPDYGILAASRCVMTLSAQARTAGATVHEHEPALEIAPDGDGVAVRTARETYRAERVILSAGSWMQPLLSSLGLDLPLTVLQEQLAYFRVRDPDAHGPDRLPLVMHRFPGTTVLGSVFPIYGHEGVKVMLDRIGPAVDPTNSDRRIDPGLLDRLRDYAAEILPGTTGEILETTSCRYTMTPDEDFIIDRHPEFPQVVFASPCSGHGFKFAPVVGQMLADQAIAGETPYPTAKFRHDRPALAESWSALGAARAES
ncbi:MAG: N-methyl-L-tryptophan oxidase [Thermomicrobiales bacterium]